MRFKISLIKDRLKSFTPNQFSLLLSKGKRELCLISFGLPLLYFSFSLWLLGFSVHVGGSLIHLLLVLVLIGIVYNLFLRGRIS
ncbi:MAG: lmo0937 family membrane protein [Microcystis sp.]|uniref:lmo0937 family membrane protein n=1 Tax=Microcystis sp. TaxID=1127 RepID=UPI00391A6B6B